MTCFGVELIVTHDGEEIAHTDITSDEYETDLVDAVGWLNAHTRELPL